MTIREETEQIERQVLSKYASFSDSTMGRDTDDPQCDLRTVYQRDRDRILHCKSFRRLKHKTQVFLSPEEIITEQDLLTHWKLRRLQEP